MVVMRGLRQSGLAIQDLATAEPATRLARNADMDRGIQPG